MEPSDTELIERARGGQTQAFEQIVARHAPGLFRLACGLVGNRADAEDVLQETFAGAFQALRRFEKRSKVRTWLGQILVRQAAALRRSRRVRQTVPLGVAVAAETGAAGPAAHVGRTIDLAAALEQLSVEHRTVMVLREFEQMSYEEMASVLGVPRGTVESRLHRARHELRDLLGDYQP